MRSAFTVYGHTCSLYHRYVIHIACCCVYYTVPKHEGCSPSCLGTVQYKQHTAILHVTYIPREKRVATFYTRTGRACPGVPLHNLVPRAHFSIWELVRKWSHTKNASGRYVRTGMVSTCWTGFHDVRGCYNQDTVTTSMYCVRFIT